MTKKIAKKDDNFATPTTKQIGHYYEDLACQILSEHGLTVIAKNYIAGKHGELDVVALESKILPNGRAYLTVVFVEVKARTLGQFGGGLDSITKAKQARLTKAAFHFLQTNVQYKDCDCRFDVIAFEIENDKTSNQTRQLHQWIQGAFLAES